MAEPTKYIWCQHCYEGWTTKEDKWYYPKCWNCGMGWRKRSRKPQWWSTKDTWDAQWPQTYPAKEVGYYPPPGLGRAARAQMSTTEYSCTVVGVGRPAGGPGRGRPRPKNSAKQSNQCLQSRDGRAEGTSGKKGHASGKSRPSQG